MSINKLKYIEEDVNELLTFFQDASAVQFFLAKAKLIEVDNLNTDFNDAKNDMLNNAVDDKDILQLKKISKSFNDKVATIRAKYFQLEGLHNCSKTNTSLQLPKVELPTFHGETGSWSKFINLFEEIVDKNDSLSDTQKFLLLQSHLKDEALSTISGYIIDGNNYKIALECLKKRYDNKLMNAKFYLNQILNYNSQHSKSSFTNFLYVHKNAINGLKKLNLNDLTDFLIMSLMYNNLNLKIQVAFDYNNSDEIPSVESLFQFIETKVKSEELHANLNEDLTKEDLNFKPKNKSYQVVSSSVGSCVVCKLNHKIYNCKIFLDWSAVERFRFIKNHSLCVKCLLDHKHPCKSNFTCRECKLSHHSLLHFKSPGPFDQMEKKSVRTNIAHSFSKSQILGTINAYITDEFGNSHKVKCVLDQGSQTNLITSNLFNRLSLKINKSLSTSVVGIGNSEIRPLGLTNLLLKTHPDDKKGYNLQIEALVVPILLGELPDSKLPSKYYHRVKHLRLADKHFTTPSQVEILLGVGVFCEIMSSEQPNFYKGYPSLLKTKFGWVVQGQCESINTFNNGSFKACLIKDSVNTDIERLCEMDKVEEIASLSVNDQFCEDHFINHTVRDISGRYSVSFPLKQPINEIKLNNLKVAERNFCNLERKISNDKELFTSYHDFMEEFIKLDHMELANCNVDYILPQLVVHKTYSTTTKSRVVFNASSKSNSKNSLNDVMFTGPCLLKDICVILFHFRLHEVTLCADIEKCYRQILINKEHSILQHVFYRKSPAEQLNQFVVKRLLYGTSAAPFLCQRVLLQLVKDEGAKYPLAAEGITNSMYLDDFIGGASSIDEAKLLRDELVKLFSLGGFTLRKFSCSHKEVINDLSQEQVEIPIKLNPDSSVVKVLGLFYEVESDNFRFNVKPFMGEITRRNILSYISRLFDPCQFIAPIIFRARLILQNSFTLDKRINWDEVLPSSIVDDWNSFVNSFNLINELKLPRKIPSTYCKVSLIAFSDASFKGYCAVAYLHCEINNSASMHFLRAKTRLTPVKSQLTIPKLELCGALLMTKLVTSITQTSRVSFIRIVTFCDSQIVLCWLKSSRSDEVFVANRVSKIKSLSSNFLWKYIPSKHNPSDLGSRGLSPSGFIENIKFWWGGPEFLNTPFNNWPNFLEVCSSNDNISHEAKVNSVVVKEKEENYLFSIFKKSSSLSKLVRVFAYVLRFINRCKKCSSNRIQCLTTEEYQLALNFLVKLSQYHYFMSDINAINANSKVSNRMAKLTPFIDANGLLRAKGRLIHAPLPECSKYPLILDKNCYLSKLICLNYHVNSLHGGLRLVQSLVSIKFFIFGSRDLIKRIIYQCPRCIRFCNRNEQPLMGDLPISRFSNERAFLNTFVDFAGPFLTKDSNLKKPRITKGYLCIFICLSVRAVHLEFVSDLSTPAFLAAFTRFTARRGLPSCVYSDNGSNFIGAAKILKDCAQFLTVNFETIYSSFATRGIKWHFQPPYASNMSGIIEAAVKSAKNLLYKQLGNDKLSYEEYTTLFCRIESILNSRPLVLSSSSGNEPDYLCPSHFLIHDHLFSEPTVEVSKNESLKCKFKKLNALSQSFWRRWSSEYLNTLIQRNKWLHNVVSPKIGDLCFLKEMNTHPLCWPLGKVVQLFPGHDGYVRVVQVKTVNGEYRRPVNKLRFLKFDKLDQ